MDAMEERLSEKIDGLRLHVGNLEARIRALEDAARPPVPTADPAPQPGLIVDPLVWRVLDKRIRWVAVDADGLPYGYSNGPELHENAWWPTGGIVRQLVAIAPDLIRMTGDWREAIAERPEGL